MRIKPAILNTFDQLLQVIEPLTNEEYSRSSAILNKSTIGQHVRHTLEFFKCLLEGYPSGLVNYDLRKRDLFLESNTLEAINEVKKLVAALEGVSDNCDLTLEQNYDEEESIKVKSNLERELVYNLEHAVHHMAIIRIAIQEIKPDMIVPEGFGVASSTLRYRSSYSQKA